ncbi:MAG TPA: hypothetical protein VLK29_12560 [Luteimonas sp.]|nr:hypothetical protein [Luteimonas sp.]
MLRELATLLGELHDGLATLDAGHGVRLARVDMTLPLDLRPVLRGGGCVLLADVPRTSAIDAWLAAPSKLSIGWAAGAGQAGVAAPADSGASAPGAAP